MIRLQRVLLLLAAVFALVGVVLLLWHVPVVGAGTPMLQSAENPGQTPADLGCRLCHSDTDAELTFPSGETLPVQVDMTVLAQSAHGHSAETPLQCQDCHRPINDYQVPHAPVSAESIRDYTLQRSVTCENCHVEPHITNHPGPDDPDTPVGCTDCHGSHDVLTVEQLRNGDGTTNCVTCHEAVDVTSHTEPELTQVIRTGLFTNSLTDGYCLACHRLPDRELEFANGDTVSTTIDGLALRQSVHGDTNPTGQIRCVECHGRYEFPHPEVIVESAREYTHTRNEVCAECHQDQFNETLDSVHAIALEDGDLEAAVCTDCHGAHDTTHPDEPIQQSSLMCRECHTEIFDQYAESIHGEALFEENNEDVPTCIRCHGVHNIDDPTTNLFRIQSPLLCADCHADTELMAKYDLSTDVFDTYVADFHGTTITLFEHQDPNVESNKAVCYDCHGVHDIKAVDDPHAGIKDNLLVTCQKCHPDATDNFPDAWTSHFKPSLENNTMVYLVDLFYAIVIPLTVVFLTFMVGTDIYRKIRTGARR
ncbi:MAG: hypothetical protein M9941_10065 [Anaerolineae bacterium]|nr:hypothetical protein [Anaerolineae bacterium]MCO5198072.1 hypothetical protein [Anaerolineae bacterium]